MSSGQSPLILILEDEAIVAMELEERLAHLGYRTAGPAATYEAALKFAHAEPLDLVIADIRLSGSRNGIDAAQTLRSDYGVPTVFLSAHADPATVRKALVTEPFGYLTKPFREQELHATIETALQRHRLERELARREAQLAEAQRIGQLGNWEWEVATNKTSVSPLLFQIFGVEPADFESNALARFLECVHPDDRASTERSARAALDSCEPMEYHFRIVRPDGEVRYMHSRSETLRNAQGKPVRIAGVSQDVTERERAMVEARDNQIRFAALFESSPDALVVANSTGQITQANTSAKSLFGYTEREFAGMEVEQLIPDSLRSGHRDRREAYRQNPHFRPMGRGLMLRAVAKDGRVIPVEISLGHTTIDGQMLVLAAIRDISERLHAEAAAAESEARFRTLFEQATDGIFVMDGDSNYLDVNESGCRLLGYSHEELSRMNARDIAVPEELEHLAAQMDRLRGGDMVLWERTFVRKDGARLPVEVSAKRRPDGLIQAMVRDITNRKRAEEALKQSEGRLRQSQKLEAVGQLAGGMAHDFNNVLQVIRGYTDLANRAVAPDAPARAHLARVLEATEHGSALTRQILTLSRGQVVQKQIVDLVPFAQQQAKLLGRLIGEDIELNATSNVPHMVVQVDPGMLHQLFINLCVNARDAMPDGGEILIELDSLVADATLCALHPEMRPGAYAVISVSDTGTGMTDEVRKHVFEPFFTTKEVGKGTGLGLFTVYGIVRHHQGTVDVFSEPGQGTTFRIYLPLADTPAAVEAQLPVDAVQGGSETVLVAEDDDYVRGLVVELLESKGYRVIQARDGCEAVETYARSRDSIGLVLLDMVMPKQSGAAVFRKIHALTPQVPVVITTGYAGNPGDSAFIRENQLPVVRKPYLPSELFRVLRETLDARAP